MATDFALEDLTLTNASATLAGSGSSYIATLTPSADGEIRLSVAAGTFTDAAGNNNTAATEVTATYDSTAPTVSIGALTATGNGTYTAAITLSEAATDFAFEDLTLTNAIATLAGSGSSYIATLTPSADGEIRLSVAADTFTDAAGNDNTASIEVTATHDSTGPTVSIGALTATGNGTYTAAITLSEAATDFEFEDLTLTNASAALAGSGSSYIATLTPSADGEIRLSVAADTFTDAAGNDNTASIEVTATHDSTGPTVSIGALTATGNGTYTAAITLSEAATDFEFEDLTLTNASAALAGSGSSYIATLTPSADGEIRLSVAAATFTDAAGNDNTASTEVTATHDSTGPTVSITGAPTSFSDAEVLTVTVTFSESVTGFEPSDITTMNATVTGISGSGAIYAATLLATGTGDVTLFVPRDVASDARGNGNLASNTVSIANETAEHTQELIAGYMQSRANQLVSSQPSLIGFLSGNTSRTLDLTASRGNGSFDFASGEQYPIWVQANGSWINDGDSESRYVFGAVGGHHTVNENLLVGAMLQFDHMDEDTGAASVAGTGWMVGPYFVARERNQALYYEGRLLYGQTRNEIRPFDTYEDNFKTKRMLAQLKVAGDIRYDTTTFSPFMDASYTTDDQQNYTDGLGNAIAKQGIALGQIEIGIDFRHNLAVRDGELEIWGGTSGIWSHVSGSGFASTVTPNFEGSRARIELGLNRSLSVNKSFSLTSHYDGIGAGDYESYGVSIGFETQF